MSKQANKATIGAFVVGALVLVVLGILMFGSGKLFKKTQTVVMYFEGSVSGLSVGAPVVFRGVKVGSVTDIQLYYDAKAGNFTIPVYAEIEPERATLVGGTRDFSRNYKVLMEKGLRAQLATQSFVTGQVMIALDFHPDTPAEFHGDGKTPEIPTAPTMLQELAKKLQELPLEDLVKDIAGAADGIDKLVNSKEIKDSLVSLDATMREVQQLVRTLNERIPTVTTSIDETLKDYGKLAKTLNGQVVDVSSAAKTTIQDYGKLARDADGEVVGLANSVGKTLKAAEVAIDQAQKTLVSAQHLTNENSPVMAQLTAALEEVGLAARSFRTLANYLERHPEALIKGKGSPTGR